MSASIDRAISPAKPSRSWAPLIIVLSLIGIIYGAIVAIVQPDLKKLVAYSSVSHMGFVTLGIFVFNQQGMQGAIVFIGSVSSQGNRGQISYASTKAGLEGAAATIMKEAVYYGVRCGLIHPGFTDTPMVRAMGDDYISKHILPFTQLSRLIRPEEIADAICFMLANSAVSGELWADAGWHAPA